MNGCKQRNPRKFEVVEQGAVFDTTHAVFIGDNHMPLCYTTDGVRAELIKDALSFYEIHGKYEKWLRNRAYTNDTNDTNEKWKPVLEVLERWSVHKCDVISLLCEIIEGDNRDIMIDDNTYLPRALRRLVIFYDTLVGNGVEVDASRCDGNCGTGYKIDEYNIVSNLCHVGIHSFDIDTGIIKLTERFYK